MPRSGLVQQLLYDLATQSPGLVVVTSRVKVADLDLFAGDAVREIPLRRHTPESGAQILRDIGIAGEAAELHEAVEAFQGHALSLALLGHLLVERYKSDVRRYQEIPAITGDESGGPAARMMAAYDGWLSGPERAVVRLLGLFDRPVPLGAIQALRGEPKVAGLNDALVNIQEPAWNQALAHLRKIGLVLADAAPSDAAFIDAHSLVREYFGEKLRAENTGAWREGRNRLYEWYRTIAEALPDTIEEMAPLYASVLHGCRAGRHQEVFDEVFARRIRRYNEHYSIIKLGAFGADLSALSGFFEVPWTRPVTSLRERDRGFVLANAGFALRAIGRLEEAVEPMRAGLDISLAIEDWKEAAKRASNLSELQLTLGQIPEAIQSARQSLELADRSGDAFERMARRTELADALHQAGQTDEAARLFIEAERLQKEIQPEYPLLYSVQGYQYCDLLLSRGDDKEARRRAEQTIRIAEQNHWILDIALDHLTLGRAWPARLQYKSPDTLAPARRHLDDAVARLHESGNQDVLAHGLIHRAVFFRHTRDFAAAARDLDESLRIATRGHMRLHEADARLERARLLRDEHQLDDARAELALARKLIKDMGYHRRDHEVAALAEELGVK